MQENLQRHLPETPALESPVEVLNAKLGVEVQRTTELTKKMLIAVRLFVKVVREHPQTSSAIALRDNPRREITTLLRKGAVDRESRFRLNHVIGA